MKIPAIAAFISICLNACAGTPVSQQTPRNYDGFSILPPQEPGWVVLAANDLHVRLQKKSSSDTHIMQVYAEKKAAPAVFSSNEEFLQYVKDLITVGDPPFYESLVNEASLSPKHGEFCAEARYKYRDFKSPRPKSALFLLHEGLCFVCIHPHAKDREYRICYWEKAAPGEEDSQFKIAGEAFIDSIQFTEPASAKPGAKKNLYSISAELADNKNRVFFLRQLSDNDPFSMKLDGKKVSIPSNGEVATVKLSPGNHSIKVEYGYAPSSGKSFDFLQDTSKYFLVRLRTSNCRWKDCVLEILDITEAEWRYLAIDPLYRTYHGQ